MADKDLLATLVDWFETAEHVSADARQKSERDRDYYDGKQLTAEEVSALNKRGQPPIVINRIKRKVNFLLGLEKSQRTDPKAYPRNPQDEKAAQAATDALRFVVEKERYDRKRSRVWSNMLVEGFGGLELSVEMTEVNGRREAEIKINQWNWDRLFYDPHSSEEDFSDARYLGTVTWMDLSEAQKKWPKIKGELTNLVGTTMPGDTYDDKPKHQIWSDKQRQRVKICQIYWKDGDQWKWCLYTKGLKIASGDVPFVDDKGDSWCPLLLQSAYVDRDNNRYGEVRDMIDPQDEVNKRRSKALHIFTMRQIVTEQGAVNDIEDTKRELAKPDGAVVLNNPDAKFEILSTGDIGVANLQLLQEAKDELDLMGPNAAMAGKDQRSQSGRAIIAQQQGGAIEASTLADGRRDLDLRMFRGVWWLIKQYWTEERWIRVTDDENNMRFVGLNRPVTFREAIQQRLTEQGLPPELVQQEIEAASADPRMDQMAGIENSTADADVDIIIEDAPDMVNLQFEQFEQLAQMAAAGVPIPPDVLIEASSLRNKDKLLEKMQSEPGPLQQLQMAEKQAEIEKTQAETKETNAQAVKHIADASRV